MPELERAEIMGSAEQDSLPRGVRIGRWVATRTAWLLGAALAVALVAVSVTATWLYLDHRDTRNDLQKAASTVVITWIDAQNAHDSAAVRRVQTANAGAVFLNSEGVDFGPARGSAVELAERATYERGIRLTLVQGPVVSESGLQAWALVHETTTDGDDQICHQVFQLTRENGVPKVDMVVVVNGR